MVCKKCEKKLAKLVTPDKWTQGSRNADHSAKGGKALATNTLAKKSSRYSPYTSKCELCKSVLHQQGKYCHPCAYKKGARACFVTQDLPMIWVRHAADAYKEA